MLGFRVGERTFLVTEQLTVYRALGDSAAVHREIRTVFAGREGMDDFREMLFTHTRLTGDEHTQIGARNLHGNLYITVEQRAVSDDAETLFDG